MKVLLDTNIILDVLLRRSDWLQDSIAIWRSEVIACYTSLLMLASKMPGSDFEDNVQIACAQGAKLDAIVTRDEKGFRLAEMPAFRPSALLAELARREE